MRIIKEITKEQLAAMAINSPNVVHMSPLSSIAGASGNITPWYGVDLAQEPSVDCTVTWPIGSVFKHSNAIYSPKPRGNGNIRIALSLLGGALIGFAVACLIGGL